MKKQIRIVIYVRVSTQEQAKEGYSIGEQIERLTKYAEAHGWIVVKVYTDAGHSGATMDRPALQEMLQDVKKGGIDKVVVYKLDRLSRSQKDTLNIIEDYLLKNNCDFESMNEKFDTSTSFGRAMVGILAVFAQLEREQIKERMSMGMEARVKEGKWRGGNTLPFGYDYDPEKGTLIVNEYESMIVKELFREFASGKKLRTIQREFIDKGFTLRNGNCDTRALRYILRNRTYLGYLKSKNKWLKGLHESFIDPEIFDRCNELLDANAEMDKLKNPYNSGTKAHSSVLGGFLYCKNCGGKYSKILYGHKRKDGTYPYVYCCYSRHKKVKSMIKDPNCKNKTYNMNVLNEVIFNEIDKLVLDPEYIHQLMKKKDVSDEEKQMDGIKKRIKEIDAQISRFMDLYGIGKYNIEQLDAKVEPLSAEQNKLQAELKVLQAESNKIDDTKAIEIAKSFKSILEKGNLEDIRSVIEALIEYIEIDNEDIFIHWKFQ